MQSEEPRSWKSVSLQASALGCSESCFSVDHIWRMLPLRKWTHFCVNFSLGLTCCLLIIAQPDVITANPANRCNRAQRPNCDPNIVLADTTMFNPTLDSMVTQMPVCSAGFMWQRSTVVVVITSSISFALEMCASTLVFE
jgi:hypothetical protein